MTTRQEIKELQESNPDGEFRTGLLIKKVGYKWVHILSLYSGEVDKMCLYDFEKTYM